MDKAAFRSEFPEFADTAAYPNAQLDFWATLAEKQLRINIWDDTRDFAVKLYVAHEVTLARQNFQAAQVGGSPGQSSGIANSKTVGSVSASYDAASQTEKDAGWWNRTTYGQQLWRLIQIFGAGCIQL